MELLQTFDMYNVLLQIQIYMVFIEIRNAYIKIINVDMLSNSIFLKEIYVTIRFCVNIFIIMETQF